MDQAPLRFIQVPSETFDRDDGLLDVCFAINDGDSRRWLRLIIVGVDDATFQSWSSKHYESAWAPVHNALAALIDNGQASAADVTSVVMKVDGTILSTSSDASADVTPGQYYAPPGAYQLPTHLNLETIPRDHLIEVKRLGPFVDLVTPASSRSERLVFKHYEDHKVMTDVWYSIQILAALSAHANFVPLRHLVLEERGGGVVGYTMPLVPGGSLEATRGTRTFKLKWAKQLFQAVDDLNLEHGIDHRDVRLRNMVVDPETDNLIIIDLGKARARGESGGTCVPDSASLSLSLSLSLSAPSVPSFFDTLAQGGAPANVPDADLVDYDMSKDADVNATIVTVHGLVTRDPFDSAWEAEEYGLWNGEGIDEITAGPWTAHPGARLDSPAEAYRIALIDWIRRRRADARCRGPAAPLAFPRLIPIPRGDTVSVMDYKDPLYPYPSSGHGITSDVFVSGYMFLRRDALRAGRPIVECIRPAATAVDPTRTLLATGRYADEEDSSGGRPEETVSSKNRKRRPTRATRRGPTSLPKVGRRKKRSANASVRR
ncbi:hypothetical protein OQA88_7436 [Cercophora sp. LCS_1]